MSQSGISAFNFVPSLNLFQVPGLGVDTLFDIQRKNIEAFSAAGQLMAEGFQTALQRQAAIAQRSIQQAQALVDISVSKAPTEDKIVQQADAAKAAYQQTVSDIRELRAIITQAASDAADLANRRLVESFDEVKAAAKAQKSKAA